VATRDQIADCCTIRPPLATPSTARLEQELRSRQQQLVEETTKNARAKVRTSLQHAQAAAIKNVY